MKSSLYFRIMCFLARILFPRSRVTFEEEPGEEPCVFISNHANIHGPIMMTLDFPRLHRTWTADCALDRSMAPNYAYHDVFFGRSRKCRWFWRLMSRFVGAALPPLLEAAGTIPAYRDQQVTRTFQQSLETLAEGLDLVIFAEAPHRFSEFVNELQSGFADLGRMWYRKTGQRLKFFPVYLEPKGRTVSVGRAVTFDPDAAPHGERERISGSLRDGIDRLARALPHHKPVSFLSPRWYAGYGEYESNPQAFFRLLHESRDGKILP